MAAAIQAFATEDMTLVAVLKTKGIECAQMEQHNGGCRWLFAPSGVIDDTLRDYNENTMTVEPREFTRKLSLVRRDMYNFLGHSPERIAR